MGFVDDPEPCGWLHRPVGLGRGVTTQRSVLVDDDLLLGHHVCDDLLVHLDLGDDTVHCYGLGLVDGLG